ncbi:MAG: VanZ family protein [Gemmatimonadaceae bacterium]
MLRLELSSPESVTTVPPGKRFGRQSYFRARTAAKARRPGPPRSTSESRARLSLVLLLYFFGVVAVASLAPFRFSVPLGFELVTGEWREVATSALLCVPLGFLFPLTLAGREPSAFRVCVLGLALGAGIEVARVFTPERVASVGNVVACAAGASVGGLLLRLVNQRIRESAKLAGRLSLETPLVALIYVLIPLVLSASLSAVGSLATMSLVPLGLLGARLISAVQEHRWRPAGVFRTRAIAIIAACWMLLGSFPLILRDPLIGAGLVLLVALATSHESSVPALHGASMERRFEAEVLRGAVPYLVVYFLTAAFLPLAGGLADWRIQLRLTGADGDLAAQMIQLLEPLTALTVLGYVLAEARGRRELAFRTAARRIVVECTCVALVMEASRAFQRDVGASVVQFTLMVLAGVFGAGLYHMQRERVRLILIQRAGHTPRTRLVTT